MAVVCVTIVVFVAMIVDVAIAVVADALVLD